MRTALHLALVCTFLAYPTNGPSGPMGVNPQGALFRKYVSLSKVDQQVHQVALLVQRSQESRPHGAEPSLRRKQVSELVSQSYSSQSLRRSFLGHLAQSLTKEGLRRLISFYSTPLGRKVARLESQGEEGLEGDLAKKRLAQAKEKVRALKEEHLTLLLEVDRLNHGTRNLLVVVSSVTSGLLQSTNEALPTSVRLSGLEVEDESERIQVAHIFENADHTLPSLVLTYGELSEKDLANYLKFLRNRKTQQYHRAVTLALSLSLEEASDRAGRAIASEVGP